MSEKIEQRLRELGEDNTSGARELADRAAGLFFDLLRSSKNHSRKEILEQAVHASNRLLDQQPSIGPLFNLANGLVLLLENCGSDVDPVEAGKEWLSLYRGKLSSRMEKLKKNAIQAIPRKAAVATYSYSSTVSETLIAAKKAGKSLRVFCSEGRPNLEGRRLAEEFRQAGIPVRFGVDAALFGWLAECDYLIVGGDAVSRRGLLNKIGTHALVLCAREVGIKVLSFADTGKIIPTALSDRLRIPVRDAGEVWTAAHHSLEVSNRYFDLTPLDLFDGVVTEEGVWDAAALLRKADAESVSPLLIREKKTKKISGKKTRRKIKATR